MNCDDVPQYLPQEALVVVRDDDSDSRSESTPSLKLSSSGVNTVEPSLPTLETATSYVDSSSDPEFVDVDSTMPASEPVTESPPSLLSTNPDQFSFPLTEFNLALLNESGESNSEAVDDVIVHVHVAQGRPFVPLVDPMLLPELVSHPVWNNADVVARLVTIPPPASVFPDHTSGTTGPLSHDDDSSFEVVTTD